MDWGDPEFVLSIVAMALVAAIIKTGIRERYRHLRGSLESKRGRGEVEILQSENSRLTERLEAYDDRIAVLERIVTDSSYRLGHEIEALRDKGKVR